MKKSLLAILAVLISVLSTIRAEPAAGASLIDPSSLDAASLKTENGATAEVLDEGGTKAVRITFPASKGYPGVDFPAPEGTWDLAASGGIALDVTNESGAKVGVALRVENPGDWQKSPWNSEVVWLSPGTDGTVTVMFGQSFGKPGFPLNPSTINKVKVFLNTPGQDGSILVHAIRPVGTPAENPASR